jgi:cystathionine gamma-synthase
MHLETIAVRRAAESNHLGDVAPPLHLSTTFERDENYQLRDTFLYSRANNPTRQELEALLAALEGGAAAMAFASGQAATYAIFQSLSSGDHVLLPDDAYYGTPLLLHDLLSKWGIGYSRVDMTDLQQVEEAIRPETRLIWIETPSNPLLKITDVAAIVAVARRRGIRTVCDNTWPTPFITNPLALGCDAVMHSTTKYLGGHSDVLAGAIVCKQADAWTEQLRAIQVHGGAVSSPFDCWLVLRGIKSLAVRLRQQCQNAQQLADFLESHPRVEAVHYPGLASHKGYAIAQRQMRLPGAMLSVQLKGDATNALRWATSLHLFTCATSLGGVESLIEHRATVEGPESRTPSNLLRISVGLEHSEDLLHDMEQAFARL